MALSDRPTPVGVIYKVVSAAQWAAAVELGEFSGSAVDIADGYLHFSTAAQVVQTAAGHFAGQRDLLLVAVDADVLGDALKWEPSRGGDLFPHLYAALPMRAVIDAQPLPLGPEGKHAFPRGFPGLA